MIISLIAAMGTNRVIGRDNKMMWHLSSEFKYFKNTTSGHCIISGRKNYEAIGSPLPNRTNIIVTRNINYKAEGCIVVHSLESALAYCKELGESEAFICGGGEIYKQAIDMVDRLYLTEVDYSESGDVYFPHFDESDFDKVLTESDIQSDSNKLAWTAYLYTKKKKVE